MRRLQWHISEHIHCQPLINSADSRDCWGGLQAFFCLSQEMIWFPHKGETFIEKQAAGRRSGDASTSQSDTISSVSNTDSAFGFCCFVAPPFFTFLPTMIHVNMDWLTQILSPTYSKIRSWKRKYLLFFLKRRPWTVMKAGFLFLITLSDSRSATPVSLTHSQHWHSPLLWGKHYADTAQSGRSINESEREARAAKRQTCGQHDVFVSICTQACCFLMLLLWTKRLNLFALGAISPSLCLAAVCVNQTLEIDMPFALMSTASIPACCGKVTRLRCALWFCVGSLFQRAGHREGQEVNDGVGSV